MTIAILSDTHLGDPATRLQHHGGLAQSAAFSELRRAILTATSGAPLDLLVLNGDILDFSIGSFAASCAAARGFFDAIAQQELARRILYLPGNHDKQIWDAVEWQVNVIDRMSRGEPPRPFRRTQPAVLNLGAQTLDLPGVSPGFGDGVPYLRGLFSDPHRRVPILVAYPNLYLVGPDDAVTVVSHGHMMALAWVLVSELLHDQTELKAHQGLAELEEYNYPVTAAICTAVGQAGAVTDLVGRVQHEVKAGRLDTLSSLIERVLSTAAEHGAGGLVAVPDALLRVGGPRMLKGVVGLMRGARHDVEFWHREITSRLLARYDEATCAEAQAHGLAQPSRYIFGHTHDHIGANGPMPLSVRGRQVMLFNTGGWLEARGEESSAAEIFFFDPSGLMRSAEVS